MIFGSILSVALVGCGGFVYTTVGGTVKGLTTDNLSVLYLGNEANFSQKLTADGAFSFRVASNAAYEIRVVTQPNPVFCTVANGVGRMASDAPVNNIAVTCVPNVQLGGTLTGLAASTSLGLSTKSATSIDANTPSVPQTPFLVANGVFTLPYYIVSGHKYSVSVSTQPVAQVCTVMNGEGSADNANLPVAKNLAVNCVAAVTIGGTVSGLKSGLTLVLSNGTSTLTVSAASTTAITYKFGDSLLDGSVYDVKVTTQPVGQTCTVSNGSGIARLPNSTDAVPNPAGKIAITCV